jgi:hypothetical protein
VPGEEAIAAMRTVRTDNAEMVRAIGDIVSGTPDVLLVSFISYLEEATYTSEKSAISRSKAIGFCNVA